MWPPPGPSVAEISGPGDGADLTRLALAVRNLDDQLERLQGEHRDALASVGRHDVAALADAWYDFHRHLTVTRHTESVQLICAGQSAVDVEQVLAVTGALSDAHERLHEALAGVTSGPRQRPSTPDLNGIRDRWELLTRGAPHLRDATLMALARPDLADPGSAEQLGRVAGTYGAYLAAERAVSQAIPRADEPVDPQQFVILADWLDYLENLRDLIEVAVIHRVADTRRPTPPEVPPGASHPRPAGPTPATSPDWRAAPARPDPQPGPDPRPPELLVLRSGYPELVVECRRALAGLTEDNPVVQRRRGALLTAWGRYDDARTEWARADTQWPAGSTTAGPDRPPLTEDGLRQLRDEVLAQLAAAAQVARRPPEPTLSHMDRPPTAPARRRTPHGLRWLPAQPRVNVERFDAYVSSAASPDLAVRSGVPTAELFVLAALSPRQLGRQPGGFVLKVDVAPGGAIDLSQADLAPPPGIRQLQTGNDLFLLPAGWLDYARVVDGYRVEDGGRLSATAPIPPSPLLLLSTGAGHGVEGLPNDVDRWPHGLVRSAITAYVELPGSGPGLSEWLELHRHRPPGRPGRRLAAVLLGRGRAIDVAASANRLSALTSLRSRLAELSGSGAQFILPRRSYDQVTVTRLFEAQGSGWRALAAAVDVPLSTVLAADQA